MESGGDLTPGEALAAERFDLIAAQENAGPSDGPSALRAVRAGIVQSGDDTFADYASFQFSHGRYDREHRFTHGSAGVERKRTSNPC